MQPVHCRMSRRVASSISGSATMSVTANRPPGAQHPSRLAEHRGLSAERLITQLEMITSPDASRQRDLLDLPVQELDVLDAGLTLVRSRELEHLVGHVESVRFAALADALAESRTSIPPPSRGRAPSRPRGGRRPRWDFRSRARRARRVGERGPVLARGRARHRRSLRPLPGSERSRRSRRRTATVRSRVAEPPLAAFAASA